MEASKLETEIDAATVLEGLHVQINNLVEAYKKRQREIAYMIERLKNLNALVNASESDIPKELLMNWLDETSIELVILEGLDPYTGENNNDT
jgi:uncharacterized coiled-coil protein SlyX